MKNKMKKYKDAKKQYDSYTKTKYSDKLKLNSRKEVEKITKRSKSFKGELPEENAEAARSRARG